ncbi:MAG: hydroxyneurosporene-O-methyltransferase [Gemmatimonadetes bacterium]|nr:hydroxyneurosporene-O-methyltransferase [Gemmatimonadota bacterium]
MTDTPSLQTLSDLRTPWCLHVVATLRIADHVAAGTSDVTSLAEWAMCDADALHRVMTHLATMGVFVETSPGQFALNELSSKLREPSTRIGLDLDGIGGRMAGAWGTLLGYVRTGRPVYRELFGRPFWEDLDAHPEIAASFDALIGPAGHGTPSVDFEVTGGWDAVRTVVDVGGGTGALLAELLRTRPHLRGILVDLPRTVARSAELFRAAGVSDRVETIGQSFFDPLPDGADLYLLKSVLNDWPDREATEILRRCAAAARTQGRVLVLGGLGPEDSTRGIEIEMVLCGGQHRTLSQFGELARGAGLEVAAAGRQGKYFVVECRPS